MQIFLESFPFLISTIANLAGAFTIVLLLILYKQTEKVHAGQKAMWEQDLAHLRAQFTRRSDELNIMQEEISRLTRERNDAKTHAAELASRVADLGRRNNSLYSQYQALAGSSETAETAETTEAPEAPGNEASEVPTPQSDAVDEPYDEMTEFLEGTTTATNGNPLSNYFKKTEGGSIAPISPIKEVCAFDNAPSVQITFEDGVVINVAHGTADTLRRYGMRSPVSSMISDRLINSVGAGLLTSAGEGAPKPQDPAEEGETQGDQDRDQRELD